MFAMIAEVVPNLACLYQYVALIKPRHIGKDVSASAEDVSISWDVPVLTWATSADGVVEALNGHWRTYCGEPPDQASSGEAFLRRVIHGEDYAGISSTLHHPDAREATESSEVRIRRHDNQYRWHTVTGSTLEGAEGPLRRFFSATETHESRTLLDDLRASERRYRETAEALPQIVWTATPEGDIDYFNAYFYEYTGYTPEAALGKAWGRLSPPEDLAANAAAWEQAYRTGHAFSHEERIRRIDGVYRWNLATARPLRAEDGSIRRWVGVTTDIDDQKHVEHHLRILDEASDLLASSLDAEANAKRVVKMIVAEISDWCGIALIGEGGELHQLVVTHQDPARAEAGMDFCRRYPSRAGGVNERVARLGKSLLIPILEPETIATACGDGERQRLLRQLDLHSIIVVPLALRGRSYGTLQVVNSRSSRSFTEADLQIMELIGKRLALAIDNARIYERERRVAHTFQRAALPASLPQVEGASLAAVYLPAVSDAEVGGDWYDAFRLDGHLVLTIGDVAGKGLEAAVLMAGVRQSLRVAAYRQLPADQMLAVADSALRAEHPEHFVTAFVAIVDTKTWAMTFASAGHPPALLRHGDGSIEELPAGAPPLGLLDNPPQLHRMSLPKHALLLLYTDGVIESTRDLYEGERRIRAVLNTDAVLRVNNPAEFVRELVLHEGARDDIAILTLRIDARRHWTFDANDAVAAHGARASFIAALRSLALPESDFAGSELIFGELIGNVVRHAPGPIDIDLTWDEVCPVLHVLDRGRGFAEADVPPHDLVRESGRGLFIVRCLSADVSIMSLPAPRHARERAPTSYAERTRLS